jgi:phenylalanyl-tRNA synthetase beta chain
MGGAETEVGEETTRLLLECAWFAPARVRRGAKRLGIPSEAAKRFERGVDPEIGPVATARFLELMEQVSPGVTRGAGRERLAGRREPLRLGVRTARIRRVAGLEVTAQAASERLKALEFAVKEPLLRRVHEKEEQDYDDRVEVTVPSWRPDVTIEDDLVEEVARSVGYDAIPEAPLETRGLFAVRSPRERLLGSARRAMLARGLDEAWCTTLVSEREALACAALLGEAGTTLVRLANPTSRDHEILRPNLLPGLFRAVALNLRQGARAVRLFELGAAFSWPANAQRGGAAATSSEALPRETWMLAGVVTGARFAHAHGDERVTGKDSSLGPVDFLDAKGIWEAWLEDLRVDGPQWRAYSAAGWKPGASAEVASETSRIGWAGTLSASLLREWEIETSPPQEVHAFVALLDPIQNAIRSRPFSLPGRFPPVRRDLAFFVPANVTHAELERTLEQVAGERLGSIELFDVYAGAGTPQGMKSMAYALEFQHDERTMTEPEVEAIQDRMVAAVAKDHGGHLRTR